MEKGDKRCAIIEAAMELVAEHGFHGAPMAMIAERAGVGAGTIYRYFENKDILIAAIYSYLEGRVLAAILEKYPHNKPIRERFVHLGNVLVRYCTTYTQDFRFIEQFHNSPYGVAHRRDKILGTHKDMFCELFQEALDQQIVKDLPLPVLFALGFGPLLNISRDQILGFVKLDDKLIAEVVEACWDALKR